MTTFTLLIASLATDLAFLKANLPPQDRNRVTDDYLATNAVLAATARETAPWRDQITDELYREYILPYSSIGENPDDWRGLFRETFWPKVKDCQTIGEAAAILNACVYPTVDVRYDTRRDKPDQSPLHSMRIHMASCTGLTILMIDAFRACGIPARFTGCNWTTIPGNHSWLEYYENGAWHFFGDPSGDKPAPVDESWFTDYAALADSSHPRTRIYAARYSPTGTYFWTTWRAEDCPSAIPADDVTEAYRRYRARLTDTRMAFVARGSDHRRVPTPFRVILSGSLEVIFTGKTYDESHDMNDHIILTQPCGTKIFVQVKDPNGEIRTLGPLEFTKEQKLIDLGAN